MSERFSLTDYDLEIALGIINFIVICLVYYFYEAYSKRIIFRNKLQSLADPYIKISQPVKKNYMLQLRRDNLLQERYKRYIRQNNSEKFNIKYKLYHAGISATVNFVLSILGIMVFSLTLIAHLGLYISILISLTISAFAVFIIFTVYLDHQSQKRKMEIIQLLPQALDIIIRGLKAGFSIEKTFLTVSHEIPEPVGNEFKTICDQISFGMLFEDAIRNAATRLDNGDFDFFVSALIIQRRIGGTLAELVSNIADSLRKREELRVKIKTLSAEAKSTGLIVGSLPFLATLAMSFLNPGYWDIFLYNPTGQVLLALVSFLIISAVVIVKHLMRFDL